MHMALLKAWLIPTTKMSMMMGIFSSITGVLISNSAANHEITDKGRIHNGSSFTTDSHSRGHNCPLPPRHT